jgi:hypothetical protein
LFKEEKGTKLIIIQTVFLVTDAIFLVTSKSDPEFIKAQQKTCRSLHQGAP